MNNRILLLHLSDIHFQKEVSGGVYDLDTDLRNELERDAYDFCKTTGDVSAILVTGDIGFGGQKEEYDEARQWLKNLSSKVGCADDHIWVTPGNHDVDRTVISHSYILKMCREKIRTCRVESIDSEIASLMKDPIARKALYQPLEKYNQFAGAYGCEISADQPFWKQDLILGDGSTLRMLGLNSALFSDSNDNDTSHRLVLGTIQALPKNLDGIEYMTLCHHPLDWLRDYEKVNKSLNARVKIQLFGHKHALQLERIENTVRLVAGAVHPERKESDWKPRYNFISVAVKEEANKRRLEVLVYPRIWHEREQVFGPDFTSGGVNYRDYELPIREWKGTEPALAPMHSTLTPPSEILADSAEDETIAIDLHDSLNRESPLMNKARRLIYRYMDLSWHDRMKVAQELDLLLAEDEGVEDMELFRRFVERAREKDLLGKMWEKIEALHGDEKMTINPFSLPTQ